MKHKIKEALFKNSISLGRIMMDLQIALRLFLAISINGLWLNSENDTYYRSGFPN